MLKIMEDEKLVENSRKMGDLLGARLNEIKEKCAILGDVRGMGLVYGLELVKDKQTKEPAPDLAKKVRTFCHRHGLLQEIGGHYDNVMRFLPPLVLTEELALKGIEIFEDAIKEAEKSV